MPRTPIIVRLDDGLDHRIVDGEITGCGQIVPEATPWQDGPTQGCTVCFPEAAKPTKATKAG